MTCFMIYYGAPRKCKVNCVIFFWQPIKGSRSGCILLTLICDRGCVFPRL